MLELFATGRIVDFVIAVMLVEGLVLMAVRQRTHSGMSNASLLSTFAPGLALLLALRVALDNSMTNRRWPIIAFWLVAALFAHLIDLRMRWGVKPR